MKPSIKAARMIDARERGYKEIMANTKVDSKVWQRKQTGGFRRPGSRNLKHN